MCNAKQWLFEISWKLHVTMRKIVNVLANSIAAKSKSFPQPCLKDISYLLCQCRSFFFAFQCLLICQALLSCVFASPVRGLVKVEAFRVLAMTATILLSESDY